MTDLAKLIRSKNLLEALLKLDDEQLFLNFRELSKLDFYLNRHGMRTKHKFTVLNHTKKLLKNFDLALKNRDNKELYKQELANSSIYKKNFFRRVIRLLKELDLDEDSHDFRVIVLVMLLHDVGKFSYDLSEDEIKQKSKQSAKTGKYMKTEYLKLYYRTKGHEERGAFLSFSKLEEAGMKQVFASRVRNLIMTHADFGDLQEDKEFNFPTFLRHIMDSATTYNYPMIGQERPGKILVRELNINYLVYLIDIFSVDDTGELWYSVRADREMVYVKAKWLLGRRITDLMGAVSTIFYKQWELDKQKAIEHILKKNFLQGLRYNTNFLLNMNFDEILSNSEKDTFLSFLNSYFDLTDKMYPFYLNNTGTSSKILHINLLKKAIGSFAFHFHRQNHSAVDVHFVKARAYEGTLLRLVRAIIATSVELDRTIKIVKLFAYSGENNRLIDIITIRHRDEKTISDEILDLLTKKIELCEKPGYNPGKVDLPITQEDLQNRIETLIIELNDIEIGTRSFQELRVITPLLSNLIIYCCLQVLAFINIINVRVEEADDHYAYIFLVSQLRINKYKISSSTSFRQDIIKELSKNVVVGN